MGYNHLFGPVASRRLGVSLGVDLVTHKVCSLDCVYCECGETTELTLERQPWVSFDAVRRELDQYWDENPDPDYITFSGSGEPSLNSELGRVIAYIKDNKPDIRVAVLTNATLMADPQVRADLVRADLVVPSLDGVSAEVFDRINRPCKGLDPEAMIRGMETFRQGFKGRLHLEIFILKDVNDTPQEISLFKTAIRRIQPDLVQLNSLDRPGTCDSVTPAPREVLERVRDALGPEGVEIIARMPKKQAPETTGKRKENKKDITGSRPRKALEGAVLETIHRRPSTVADLAEMLGAAPEEILSILNDNLSTGRIESREQARGVFYQTRKAEH
ncbi:MAG TPA: radical SAM protein [Desulfobacteraceae bacterium]|nr:radical SAM protein [Desulfobacteraceae bacterium]